MTDAPEVERTDRECFEGAEDALLEGDRPFPLRQEPSASGLSALRNRTFRIVYFGAFASNVGTWMQNVVLGALAYDLTKSSEFVGLLVFAQLGPLLLLSLVGGALADTFDRRRILVLVSVEQIAFTLALAWLVRSPHPSHALLFLLVLAIGVGQAIYAPTFTATLPGLVGRENLSSAISLNSAQMNASRVIGPAIGSLLYAKVGASWVFTGNAVSYVFIILALLVVQLPPVPFAHRPQRPRDLLTGIGVARADRVVTRCLVSIYLFSFFCLPFVSQMPVLAHDNLGIAPKSTSYGLLYASFGLGAVAGALAIGTRVAMRWKPYLARSGLVAFAVALAVFALLRTPGPAYPMVFLVGFAYFATITALSTVIQERVDDAVRGRVMALWIMGFGGTVPLGALASGPLIAASSVTTVVLGGAIVALAIVAIADLRDRATIAHAPR